MKVPYEIHHYQDFVHALMESGFSMLGGNVKGVFTLIPWAWNQEPPYPTDIRWHTGNPDTDPWQWRIRVVEERKDIAYAKLFLSSGGDITKQWYPYFLSVRRGARCFDAFYQDGVMSLMSKRIYRFIEQNGAMPVHLIKANLGVKANEKNDFDRAIVQLQMGMFITVCGQQQKLDRFGIPYGWNSMVFCTIEQFFGSKILEMAEAISSQEAAQAIATQIKKLNPNASEKAIDAFLKR